jgi:hypothetical protein
MNSMPICCVFVEEGLGRVSPDFDTRRGILCGGHGQKEASGNKERCQLGDGDRQFPEHKDTATQTDKGGLNGQLKVHAWYQCGVFASKTRCSEKTLTLLDWTNMHCEDC